MSADSYSLPFGFGANLATTRNGRGAATAASRPGREKRHLPMQDKPISRAANDARDRRNEPPAPRLEPKVAGSDPPLEELLLELGTDMDGDRRATNTNGPYAIWWRRGFCDAASAPRYRERAC